MSTFEHVNASRWLQRRLISNDGILALVQVGYSKKMANVWSKVAEEAAGSSNRSSEASSSGFSTPS